MAPEIIFGRKYEGAKVDIFASAVILFIMLLQRPPYECAHPQQNPHYEMLAAGRADLFWQAHEASPPPNPLSAEFKDLFEKMQTLNPSKRPSVAEIISHPWMNGPTASQQEIRAEFSERKKQLDAILKEQRDQKKSERAGRKSSDVTMRGDGGKETIYNAEFWANLEMEEIDYEDCAQTATKFFTTCEENGPIFIDVLGYLDEKKMEHQVPKDQWKLKYSFKDAKYNGEDVQVTVYISKIADRNIKCVEFVRTKGYQQAFSEHYRDLAQKLEMYRDATYVYE